MKTTITVINESPAGLWATRYDSLPAFLATVNHDDLTTALADKLGLERHDLGNWITRLQCRVALGNGDTERMT